MNVALVTVLFLPLTSHAVLGGAPSASSSAPMQLRAAQQSETPQAAAPYTLRETHDADGVTIREYVLPTNVVFAVSWEGPVRPDMSALLGSYFPNYVSNGESRARGTGPLIERDGDFQLESAGRPGHFFGKAYVSRLVPANVNLGDLQ